MLEVLVHFVPEVFSKIHVKGLWTPWQYYDGVIVVSFECKHVGMFWVVIILEHPILFFLFRTSQVPCSGCHVRCYDNACC